MTEFRSKRISVIGAARSGLAAADILVQLGAEVLLSDSGPAEKLGSQRLAAMEATGARWILNATPRDAVPDGTELVVTSPGVPKTAPVLQEAVRRGIPVWSEIELAYRLTDAPIVAVTGTNGKTTTTVLIAAMLQEAGQNAVIAGNVSADAMKRTLAEAAFAARDSESTPQTVLVAEISSFQLEWTERFAPKVAVLTNITPDHLNRHASFAEYAQTKARLFAFQTQEDWAVLNFDDPAARQIGLSSLPAKRCRFTRQNRPPDAGAAAWVQNGIITVRLDTDAVPILPTGDLPFTLPGAHSVENVLAASAAALAMGADPQAIAKAVRAFPGVAHRMEFVTEAAGVRYINNSMCTNVAAAVRSLEAMDRPTIVIAGGADKDLDFTPLAWTLRAKAKHLILIGTTADKMEAQFHAGGYDSISRAASLEEAVQKAKEAAQPGEAVLLSPACASFDMFADFEARGAAFRRIVHLITETDA